MNGSYRSEDCTLNSIVYEIVVWASISVDQDGQVNDSEARGKLLDALDAWEGEDEPYYCQGCGANFKRWEDVQEHLSLEVEEWS